VDFSLTEKETSWRDRVRGFIDEHVRPRAADYRRQHNSADAWAVIPVVEELKALAQRDGLWNLFMPPGSAHLDDTFAFDSPGLTNVEYALCAEEMGRIAWASEVFNCSAPDTGNMEVLHRYGTRSQKDQWLAPLMHGTMRSAFLMTEPDVASSDATNIATRIDRDGDHYVISGRKWWSSGVGDPRCRIAIVMGQSDQTAPVHQQQSMILVPMDAPGVELLRLLPVFGYDDRPHGHGEVQLTNVRVPATNMLLGEGRGFEIAQGRLGPGRIHHCMRAIGMAEEAMTRMAERLMSRSAFGQRIGTFSVWEERIARGRIDLEMTRLLCLKAAQMIDTVGAKAARLEIAMIKVAAPRMLLSILDDAIQAHGGAGVSDDVELAHAWAQARTLRLVDGPDEVHNRTIARMEFNHNAPPGTA
jgi:acyl-CoA dehydrogenase